MTAGTGFGSSDGLVRQSGGLLQYLRKGQLTKLALSLCVGQIWGQVDLSAILSRLTLKAAIRMGGKGRPRW